MEREIVQDFERIESLAHMLEGDHPATRPDKPRASPGPSPSRSHPPHQSAFLQRMTRLLSGRSTPNSMTAIRASSTSDPGEQLRGLQIAHRSGEGMSDPVHGAEDLSQHHRPHADAGGQGQPGHDRGGDPRHVDLGEEQPPGELVHIAHLHQPPVDGQHSRHRVHVHGGDDDHGHHEDDREVAQTEPEHGKDDDDDRRDGHPHPAERLEERAQPGLETGQDPEDQARPAPMARPITRRLSVMSNWIQRVPSQARRTEGLGGLGRRGHDGRAHDQREQLPYHQDGGYPRDRERQSRAPRYRGPESRGRLATPYGV